MNHSNIKNLSFYQQVGLAVLTLIFGCTAGYSATGEHIEIQEPQTYDAFSPKAYEVHQYMEKILANPTEDNLRYANNHLKVSIKNWEEREYGENKELFHEYRLACQDVIDGYQEGESEARIKVKMDKMDKLYNELN